MGGKNSGRENTFQGELMLPSESIVNVLLPLGWDAVRLNPVSDGSPIDKFTLEEVR